MDVIWAPWRMQYILGEKEMGCFLCQALEKGVSPQTLMLFGDEHSLVILNRYPYISGHLLVAPARHVSSLDLLDDRQMAGLHQTLRVTVRAVQEILKPHGINVGMNLGKAAGAGLEDHLHYHVVPRFMGDNNAMSVIANARVIPESLEATFQRFRPWFESNSR